MADFVDHDSDGLLKGIFNIVNVVFVILLIDGYHAVDWPFAKAPGSGSKYGLCICIISVYCQKK